MPHTVVGVFDSSREAQTAVQQLVSNGLSRDRIDVSPQTASNTSANETHKDNDSIGDFFRSLFGSDEKSDHYSNYARTGSVITVHATSAQEAERAADIMDKYGAVNLDERATGAGYAAGTLGATDTAPRDLDTTRRDTDSTDKTIPIIEENLHVGKRDVETGGVRVRSRIIEKPIEEHLRLREEHVHVERNTVNRPASEADLNRFKEGEISMTEHAEVPMVDKKARVVEEVRIGKDVEEHVEDIHDTVRKTDVDIDNLTEEELQSHRTGVDADANMTDEELRRRRSNTDPNRPRNI